MSQRPILLLALFMTVLTSVSTVLARDDDRHRGPVPELPSPVCDEVNVPPGNRLFLQAYASGVQIYRWNGTSWAFIAPEATLFADPCYRRQVATHYAGPTWEANDGSKVVAVFEDGCAPYRGAIPWLLLKATPTSCYTFWACQLHPTDQYHRRYGSR